MTAIFTPKIPPVAVPADAPEPPAADKRVSVDAADSKAERKAADKGPGTRRRLLDAAAELFATKGYRNVAVRDICEQACANVAAVNYHFGSKDQLHLAAIDHARQRALQEEPVAGEAKAAGPLSAEQKLRRHLRAMLGRAFATGPAGWYMQIVLRELTDPTPALAHALDDHLGPHQRRLEAIVGQVLGQDPDQDRVKDTASALLATAIYYHSCRPAITHLRPDFAFDQDATDRLTDLLSAMVTGGIASA
jgi:AcrR family transcriptional regulator